MKIYSLITLTILVVGWCSISSGEIELKVAYERNIQFPNYLQQGKDVPKKNPGAVVELVKMLEKKNPGLKVKFERYPWKRCLFMLKMGKVDATFNSSYKKKRVKMGAYPTKKNGEIDKSRRITSMSYYIYKLKDSPLSWNGFKISHLKGKIGAILGFSIVDDLKKRHLPVEESKSTLSNLKKIIHHRIAGAALQSISADYYLEKDKKLFKNIVKLPIPLKTKEYYLMLSYQFIKKYPNLSKKIWNSIKELREEKLKGLIKKYFEAAG